MQKQLNQVCDSLVGGSFEYFFLTQFGRRRCLQVNSQVGWESKKEEKKRKREILQVTKLEKSNLQPSVVAKNHFLFS